MYVIKPANLLLLSFANQVAELFISDFHFSIVTDTKNLAEKIIHSLQHHPNFLRKNIALNISD